MSVDENLGGLRAILKGKKRYILIAGVVLTSLAGWLGGDLAPAEAINIVLRAVGLAP